MRFPDTRPLLPSFVVVVAVGAFFLLDSGPEKQSFPTAVTQSDKLGSPTPPMAELATLREIAPVDSTGLTKVLEIVQSLQSSNKSLSDQVGALTARLDNLERARAEVSNRPQGQGRRR